MEADAAHAILEERVRVLRNVREKLYDFLRPQDRVRDEAKDDQGPAIGCAPL